MLDTILGLPLHPLVVHATVVIVPTATLLVALAAVYPRFRAWAGPVPALTALLAVVLVPLSTGSGESLEGRVGDSHLVHEHAEIAGTLIWFVIPLAAVAVAGYWMHRRSTAGQPVAGKGLVTAVAAGVGGGLLDPQIAYVTADSAFRTPFARGYRVLEELPYRERALRAALRERGIGRLTIKKRGVAVVPEELRRRLSLQGPNEATVVLTRVAEEGTCLLVQPF